MLQSLFGKTEREHATNMLPPSLAVEDSNMHKRRSLYDLGFVSTANTKPIAIPPSKATKLYTPPRLAVVPQASVLSMPFFFVTQSMNKKCWKGR